MFFKLSSVLVLVLTFSVLGVFTAPAPAELHQVTALPEDIPTCQETDKVDDCIRSAIQQMLIRSKNGVPELNIQPIDPMILEKTSLQFQNNLIQGKAGVRNLKIAGLSKSIVDKAHFKRDGNKIMLTTQVRTPKLQVDGQYKAEVFINNSKMSSKGIFNVTIEDIDSRTDIEAESYERDGHTYLRITSLNIDPVVGNMKIFATGLVPDPVLNDALLDFANQNWRTIYKTVIPETRSTWEPMFLKNANEFFTHLPFDLILKKST